MSGGEYYDDEPIGYYPGDDDDVAVAENDEEEDPGYCSACAGSGEGMYDGSTCSSCKGSGETKPRNRVNHFWNRR